MLFDDVLAPFPAVVVEPLPAVVVLPAAVVAVLPDDDGATAVPFVVPPFADGGGAVELTTPQVGVVCPACTSAGVRSPHAYACCSAAVGATAPGTFFCTAFTPYCSSDRPRLA
jgi:hypothetical protein